MELLTVVSALGGHAVQLGAEESGPLFQINLFQVIVAALNFVVFLVLMWTFAFKPVAKMLEDRKASTSATHPIISSQLTSGT